MIATVWFTERTNEMESQKREKSEYLQVQWVEEQDQIFAFVLGQIDFLKFTIDDGGAGKAGSWFIQSRHVDLDLLRNNVGINRLKVELMKSNGSL